MPENNLSFDTELDQQHQNPQWGDIRDDKGRLSASKQVSPRLALVITLHPYVTSSDDESYWVWHADDTAAGAKALLFIGTEGKVATTPGEAMDMADDAYRRHCEEVVRQRQERAAAAERKALVRAANLDALRAAIAARRGLTD